MVFTFSVLIGLMLFTGIGYAVTIDYKWSLLKKAIWSLGLILLESLYLQCFYWLLHWGEYGSISIFHSHDTRVYRDRSSSLYPSSGTGTHLEIS